MLLRRGLCHYGIKVDHAVQAGGGKGGTVRAVLIGNHPPHSQATNGAGASTYERLDGECSNTDGPEAVFPMAGVLKPNHKHRKYLQQTDTQNNETEIFSYPPVVLISHTSLRKILELERNLTNQSTRRGGRSRGIPTTSEVIITVENVTTSHVPLLRNSELGAAVRGACLDGDEALLQCLIHHMADVKGRKNRARGLSSLLEGHLAEDDGSGAAALVGGGEQKGDGEGSGGENGEGGGTRHAREEAGSGVGEKGLDVRGAEMLRFLDEQDVDRGVSALHVAVEAAVESQSYGCLKTLLAAGVDTELLRTDGYNALHIAVEAGNVDVVTMLLDSGSWVDAPQVINANEPPTPPFVPSPNHHTLPPPPFRSPPSLTPLQPSAGAARLDQPPSCRQKRRPRYRGTATKEGRHRDRSCHGREPPVAHWRILSALRSCGMLLA